MADLRTVTSSSGNAFWRTLFEPLFSEILRYRALCAFLAVLALAQIVTAARHVTIIFCPFAHVLGLPCPGCGLTRATVYFSAGHWRQAMVQHAFAPVVLGSLVLLVVCSIAPARVRDKVCQGVAAVERRTALMPMLFFLLLLYWAARLIVAPHDALVELRL